MILCIFVVVIFGCFFAICARAERIQKNWPKQKQSSSLNSSISTKPKTLSYADKERITVQRVTIQDMQQFSSMPYLWNSDIKKNTQPGSHAFAYMDLVGSNVFTAKEAISAMSNKIRSDSSLSKSIPKGLSIPIDDLVFKPSKYYGHTRLMCTPFSYSGEISKHIASLSFMTDLSNESTSTHGELFYSPNGNITKAIVCFWRRKNGTIFYYDDVDGILTLSRVEIPTLGGSPAVVYKGQHIIAREIARAQHATDYKWIQRNLPNLCPKSISGYSRMKNQNTKNYQKIVQAAAEKGYTIK